LAGAQFQGELRVDQVADPVRSVPRWVGLSAAFRRKTFSDLFIT